MKKLLVALLLLVSTNTYAIDVYSIDPVITARCAGMAQAYGAFAKVIKATPAEIASFEQMDSAWRGLTVNIIKRKGLNNFDFYDTAIEQQRNQILSLLDSNFNSGRDLLVRRYAECQKLYEAIKKTYK